MENNNKKETFEYTYSSKQQEEIESIRKKYLPKEENKMELLRKLDRDVTNPGTIWSIIIGVIGCLMFGGGMSLVMVAGKAFMAAGIVMGLVGIAVMAVALPVYKKITEKQRERIAPQILALTEELMK